MLTPPRIARVDFHLHSLASNVTDYYAANVFSIPESWSDPKALYTMLKARGMDLVTLTDHNSIDGVKVLLDAGLPDVFISSEITCRFPEDGCNIHVTVANVDETQFAEVMRLRGNVYEMLAYLRAERAGEGKSTRPNHIGWFMTHPLMSTQNRPYGRDGALTIGHIEKMLLVCPAFEVQNGARTRALNELTASILDSLTPDVIERLAERHGIDPVGSTPWIKARVGGSDDHAGINPGRTWTQFPYVGASPTPNGLIDCLVHAETGVDGLHGGPITLAHALLKLLHDTGERRGGAGRPSMAAPIRPLLRVVFASEQESALKRLAFAARALVQQWIAPWRSARAGRPFEEVLDEQVYLLLGNAALRGRLAATASADERIFLVLNALLSGIFAAYFDNLLAASRRDVLTAIKEFVALVSSNVLVSLPYFASFLQQSSDSLIARDARGAFELAQSPRLVLVTDTFFDVNGVAGTIRRMIRESVRRGIEFTVVTCLSEEEQLRHLSDPEVARWIDHGRLKVLTAIRSLNFPEYEGLKVRFPPLLDLLRFVQEGGFTKMQISTPGTMGVAGLFAAKLLQIETAATYHTSFPEYVENYTRDVALEALAWKYMIMFYHSVDEVVVPSKFVARLLHKRGLRKRKLLILDRWVDIERFHPRHRIAGFWEQRGIPEADRLVKFIYVGRIGVEKNLALLASAFRGVAARHADVHLILVGDGPFRNELADQLTGLPVTFTGFLEGAELARALACADVKLFPSTTDTWGNAPLEAQASGTPVIVSRVGGPFELMVDGETGIAVSGLDVEGLVAAMEQMLDPEVRRRMSVACRAFAVRNDVTQPFTAILDSAGYRASLTQGGHSGRGLVRFPDPLDPEGDPVDPPGGLL
jgi:glycosyltransferase involved in cell wall biosynthesis